MCNTAANLLLDWYDRHKRILPWRDVKDPYKTWVSEIMLQQTRVETVMRYFERFMEAFPTVQALAEAHVDDVLKLWEGLGYYRRARSLHQGAKDVMEKFGGILPKEPADLKKIAGVGDYTAGAIASIAYGVKTPAVDGNVIRVVSRLHGIRENVGIPSVKREIERLAADMVPDKRPGDYNQAVMDLGATVCVPGTPDCASCPLRALCTAYEEGDADELPVLPMKNPPKVYEYDVYLIASGERIVMRQRTESLLHGLWVYPMTDRDASPEEAFRMQLGSVRFLGEAKHVFTHQVWLMRLYAAEAPGAAKVPKGMSLHTADEMETLTIPSAMAAAKKEALKLLGR